MPNKDLKNIVVLKNLPSNIIDEAIVILKENKNAKKLQYVENKMVKINTEMKNDSGYIVKEAESVIASYISKIEGGRKFQRKLTRNIENKYKRMKIYNVCMSIIAIVCVIKGLCF